MSSNFVLRSIAVLMIALLVSGLVPSSGQPFAAAVASGGKQLNNEGGTQQETALVLSANNLVRGDQGLECCNDSLPCSGPDCMVASGCEGSVMAQAHTIQPPHSPTQELGVPTERGLHDFILRKPPGPPPRV